MAATYNLVCPQATTFNFQFVVKTNNIPWDLTNYTGTMSVKPFVGSSTTTLIATTENGKMVIQPTNGRINVTFNATDTNIKAETYAYDLVLYSGSTTRILEGQFIVTAGVTV